MLAQDRSTEAVRLRCGRGWDWGGRGGVGMCVHVAICLVSYYGAVHNVHVMGCRRLCENEVCLYTYKLTYARTCV